MAIVPPHLVAYVHLDHIRLSVLELIQRVKRALPTARSPPAGVRPGRSMIPAQMPALSAIRLAGS